MDHPVRKNLRLAKYDYSAPGVYFVTVCSCEKRCILATIRRGDPCGRPDHRLTEYGSILVQCLAETESLYGVTLSPFVIMPNHIHFLCHIGEQRATARVAPTLGRIVGAFKSLAANRCREAGLDGALWQRSFYEHIVRSDAEYREITEYIMTNPVRWAEDPYHSEAIQNSSDKMTAGNG